MLFKTRLRDDPDMSNALLVYPKFPPSYWGYNFALEFVGKKSALPPLGLLTVAGMFPKGYQLKVVDMNITSLTKADLDWADFVFTSTMVVQKNSLFEVITQCNQARVPVVAGGPYPTSYCEDIVSAMKERGGWIDHFLLDEVEEIFPSFLEDLKTGIAKPMYQATNKPDVTQTPLPRYDLIDLSVYGSMALQFSRGCPFDCEFCDITKLFGRVPRTKTTEQVLAEFNLLYNLGWRGSMFLVDDNFIGNKRDAMRLLPVIAEWQKERDYPFGLYTEASVNIIEIPDVLEAMAEAGFNMTFLGIETPNEESLVKTAKKQNTHKTESARDYLLRAVRTIQEHGIEVTAGFIIGLDRDKEFQPHIDFIQEAGIPRAMAGLLTALKNTNLYHRLESEGRLLHESVGNNVSTNLNFVPELDRDTLVSEYKRVLRELYQPSLQSYFNRCLTMFENLTLHPHLRHRRKLKKISQAELIAFVKSIRYQLFSRHQGLTYLKFLLQVLKHYPYMFAKAVRIAIQGYHFEKVTSQETAIDDFNNTLKTCFEAFKQTTSKFAKSQDQWIGEVRNAMQSLLNQVHTQYSNIHQDFRCNVRDALDDFQELIFKQYLEKEFSAFRNSMSQFTISKSAHIKEIRVYTRKYLNQVYAQHNSIHQDFRYNLSHLLNSFRDSVENYVEVEWNMNCSNYLPKK